MSFNPKAVERCYAENSKADYLSFDTQSAICSIHQKNIESSFQSYGKEVLFYRSAIDAKFPPTILAFLLLL